MPEHLGRRVKIVATLGPASHEIEILNAIMDAGLDVVRLNFSHGDHEYHQKTIENVRKCAEGRKKFIPIMQDLQGPKIRVGALPKAGVKLEVGDHFILYPEGREVASSTKGKKTLPITNEFADAISKAIRPGALILFDDGKLRSRVLKVSPPEIEIEIEVAGTLTSHKGMNLPGTPLPIPCLTNKDLTDLKFGLSQGVDAVALSFVRSAADIDQLRSLIRDGSNERPIIISKIEREEAIEYQDDIIDVSDGLMVARGDLAVEIGAERVPTVQKQLIRACNELGVPIITATQMLESMILAPTPTRAEASDVANAVFDGTDAVMLSGETASGSYPVEAVKMMSNVIIGAEQQGGQFSIHQEVLPIPGSIVDSIEFSAARIAHHVGARSIACVTRTGQAARTVAKYRPQTQIIAISDDEAMLRKLGFVWGVSGELIPEITSTDDVIETVETVMMDHGRVAIDDTIVITAGVPTLRRGTTNMIKVHRVGAAIERAGRN